MKNDRKKLFRTRTLANMAVVCAGVLLFLGLSNFSTVWGIVSSLLAIFQPFIVAIAIAYLLNLPLRFFEARLFARFKRRRTFSILLTYLLAVLLLAMLLGLVLPQLAQSIGRLVSNIQGYINNFNSLVGWVGGSLNIQQDTIDSFLLSYENLLDQVIDWVRQVLPNLLNVTLDVTRQVGSGLVGAITAIIASIYMLYNKEKLLRQCRRVLYATLKKTAADGIMRVGRLSNSVFSGFISGKIIDSAIIGVICFVFMSVMNLTPVKMPYALLISVIVGVTNIIPFFGPFIGAIPSIFILLMMNPWSALWFTVFIIVLQQVDGNLIGPKILGNSTGLPAMWVLIAIIVGGGLFGFMGMLLGVPATAVLYALAGDFVQARLDKRGLGRDPGREARAPAPADATDGPDKAAALPQAENAAAGGPGGEGAPHEPLSPSQGPEE